MRCLVLLLALLAGCKPSPYQGLPDTHPIVSVRKWQSTYPKKFTSRYKGRTAYEWSLKLNEADDAVSNNAAFALKQIGEEGAPFLLMGMDSPLAATRERCAQHFPVWLASRHAGELVHLLSELLTDPNPRTRINASTLSSNASLSKMLPHLEAALEREQDENVRQTLQASIKTLKGS